MVKRKIQVFVSSTYEDLMRSVFPNHKHTLHYHLTNNPNTHHFLWPERTTR